MGMLDGKVAVVSGAARGQGRAHALRFAEEGADIIAIDICGDVETVEYPGATSADLAETVAQVEANDRRIVATEADVRDSQATAEAIRRGAEELGRIDFLIANAGIISYRPAPEVSDERWDAHIDVDLTGVWNCARPTMQLMLEAGNGGSLVFTSSAVTYIGVANNAPYSAAKAGLLGLMRSLAVELGPESIRVNTIHPCSVKTGMIMNETTFELMSGGEKLSPDSEADMAKAEEVFQTLSVLPVPWAEAKDIANAALFLCSDMGRYVTGTELRVDAGWGVK